MRRFFKTRDIEENKGKQGGRDRSVARAALGGELPSRTLSVERRVPKIGGRVFISD
jgi:hypothetical protein